MPKLTVKGVGDFEIAAGKRLVKALVEDAGIDQLHACGGQSRCTSCRVKIVNGEPDQITEAEKETLRVREISDPGVRLSCQLTCDQDIELEIISRLEGSGRKDLGSAVSDEIQPDPKWTTKT
ncbi:(2Fe-2S)-binding protein [bacterium]|nr:(2Fe-2S)-binding protein [bacterium]